MLPECLTIYGFWRCSPVKTSDLWQRRSLFEIAYPRHRCACNTCTKSLFTVGTYIKPVQISKATCCKFCGYCFCWACLFHALKFQCIVLTSHNWKSNMLRNITLKRWCYWWHDLSSVPTVVLPVGPSIDWSTARMVSLSFSLFVDQSLNLQVVGPSVRRLFCPCISPSVPKHQQVYRSV